MNRQPVLQPHWNAKTDPNLPMNHYYDEDLDRRVLSADGNVAVMWSVNKHVKKPTVWKPRLVLTIDNSPILFVTNVNREWFIRSQWTTNDLIHHVAIRKLPFAEVDITERLLATYEAAKK